MIKRVFDIIFSLVLILLLSPVYLLVCIFIYIKLGKPVVFSQKRPGLDGKIFTMYKYRSMLDDKDPFGNHLPDEKRLTKFGKLLRASSLDELPSIYNILKGEMSFVGPRPLLVEYLPLYSAEQAKRHNVKPGLTGWAQINGRNSISWQEKFDLDVWYVNNRSLYLDIQIMFVTLLIVMKSKDINSKQSVTMDRFKGNNG